ncbi:hypothetical protein GL982_12005 (plasmid) [Spiroplasma citri]|uniref:Uncharacterized protein n=1 Tax=Spiroplasma citri TaxID=2133 RepID=Q9EV59_SPICI|nr:hypothetical protein [Spiroplasma citri]QIA74252.1 hypothetical protein GL982_12005 [Spiroplasma citri]CAC10362.1 hypothetical protein [Spiroplasma citri]CAI99876.1 hypothetical protein [Spiroplasma citri]
MKKINETIKSKIISILKKNDISIKDFDNFWEKTKTLVNIKNKLRGANSAVEEWERKKSNPIKYYGTFGFNSLNEASSYQMKYIKLWNMLDNEYWVLLNNNSKKVKTWYNMRNLIDEIMDTFNNPNFWDKDTINHRLAFLDVDSQKCLNCSFTIQKIDEEWFTVNTGDNNCGK